MTEPAPALDVCYCLVQSPEAPSGEPNPYCPRHGKHQPAPALDVEALRALFLRFLTTDSPHHDRRRKDFNQAIFHPEGWAIWSSTDLDMVMSKFDKAAEEVTRG